MSFLNSISTCLTKYFVFSGRATRSEFWFFHLFAFLVLVVDPTEILWLFLIFPSLAVGSRRLHDIGRSGWWQLLHFVPAFGLFALLIFFLLPTLDVGSEGATANYRHEDDKRTLSPVKYE